ncbi:hypothetical protein SFRURICE_008004, partial [Spodoptera frugiperda]
ILYNIQFKNIETGLYNKRNKSLGLQRLFGKCPTDVQCHSHSKYESNDSYQAEFHRVVQARDISLTINTNLTKPLKPKSIKPFRLQSVPNNYTYIGESGKDIAVYHSPVTQRSRHHQRQSTTRETRTHELFKMPRNYKRKTETEYSLEDPKKVIVDVQTKKLSIGRAANTCVPKTTIYLRNVSTATNGCASRNKIGALGEVRFKTVALRGIPRF